MPDAIDVDLAKGQQRHWTGEEIAEIRGVVSSVGFFIRWNDSMVTTLEAPATLVAAVRLAARRSPPVTATTGSHQQALARPPTLA